MKKKGLLVATTTVLALSFFAAACGNNDNNVSKDAVSSGNTNIIKGDYSAAATYYKVASKYSSDSKTKGYYSKASKLDNANQKMDDYQLTSALSEAKSVKGGTRAIISARKKLVRKITVRKQTAQAFNHEIELAQQSAKSGNTASALGTINDLLGDKDIQSKPTTKFKLRLRIEGVTAKRGISHNADKHFVHRR